MAKTGKPHRGAKEMGQAIFRRRVRGRGGEAGWR